MSLKRMLNDDDSDIWATQRRDSMSRIRLEAGGYQYVSMV